MLISLGKYITVSYYQIEEIKKLSVNNFIAEQTEKLTLAGLGLQSKTAWASLKIFCFFQRLSRPEVLENIMMATPGLSEDPVAISIIQDPELLVHMENADTVRR